MIGFIYYFQVEHPKAEQMENILLEMTSDYDFQVLKINDFGHNCPNTTIPIGVRGRLDASNKTVAVIEDFIK